MSDSLPNIPDTPLVIVRCEPDWRMVLAGAKALDAWRNETARETIDGSEMARRVWKAMTSASTGSTP